jgi:hypothetical protein
MLLGNVDDITPDTLRSAIPLARSLFPKNWFDSQSKRIPNDPLFYTRLPLLSEGQISHALRHGPSSKDTAHPLAEAILGAEKVVAYYDEHGEFFTGMFVYRLLSLRDIGANLHKIENAQERLPKLRTDEWRATLYELLVACSQATVGQVTLLPEAAYPVPDMSIDASIYLECKAKIQHQEKVLNFVERVKRLALDGIFREAAKISDGLRIEIDVHDESAITSIPSLLRSMIAAKLTRKSSIHLKIKIKPYLCGPFELPQPMKVHSAELWRWLMDFNGWNEWHLVQPFGEFVLDNVSNVMVKSVRRPILVCVKSTKLSNSTQDIRSTVASACRRQLKNHQPGIVRVLVNSALYGIGPNAAPAEIKSILDALSLNLLSSYSRLAAVRFDIVTPPEPGSLQVHYVSAGAAKHANNIDAMISTPGVLLL